LPIAFLKKSSNFFLSDELKDSLTDSLNCFKNAKKALSILNINVKPIKFD
jgi:hypothetical protein